MERYLYTSMSGALHTLTAQRIHANNLANSSTTGFRRDFERAETYQVKGAGLETKYLSQSQSAVTDFTPGRLETTGRDLDVGIRGAGFLAVIDEAGNEAYTRVGNLSLDAEGQLRIRGREVVGAGGGQLAIPEYQAISIGDNGTISVTPPGGGQLEAGQLKLVNPPLDQLRKGEDGLFRLADGEAAAADPEVLVVSGHLEQSNVNPVDEMVTTMALSRTFEIQMRMMKAADENSNAGNRLVRGG
ncbi:MULTISPECIES: flagellar basal body rod protein FlgF [Marinobacter]|uniref:flagellar basal body rod protein FlgF n=1 Tax=Marinobacter TaxID=2742 RepID=UPI001D076FE5|nr:MULTISPECIES: flagellar basal body rod protein FlgF [Marinobacter]MCK7567355.1 flagellar basal body rod protein FlgF [Marinobacter xestospongiae]UDL05529.1 flagellar basal body rod protein FlgF [Marinobacter sp. CA1]